MTHEDEKAECCPKFDPAPWDDRLHTWDNKRFLKDRVRTLFFMPVNFGSVMRRIQRTLHDAGATMPEGLCLSDHTSRWNMDVYIAVDREVQGAHNTALAGTFFSKVYEGDFRNTGDWCKDFETRARGRGLDYKKMYMWYTTCPRCARKYGKNYVVILARV